MSDGASGINWVSISRDGSAFGLALDHSIRVYQTDPLKRKYLKDFASYRIERTAVVGDGSLVAFTASLMERYEEVVEKVFVWNTQLDESQCQLDFKEPIRSIALTYNFLLVILEQSTVVYDLEKCQTQGEMVTSMNPHGAGDLITSEGSLIAVCGLQPGKVSINDLTGGSRPVVFQAHQHPINLIRFSPDGAIVATASDMGTLIRLFDSVTGSHLCVFRRGTIPSRVLSVCFSPGNSELIAVSESGTVHLFDGDTRNSSDSDPPRSIGKLSIGRVTCVDCMFISEEELIVVTSAGHMHKARCSGNTLRSTGRAFVLSH